jgi:hypothetical protein
MSHNCLLSRFGANSLLAVLILRGMSSIASGLFAPRMVMRRLKCACTRRVRSPTPLLSRTPIDVKCSPWRRKGGSPFTSLTTNDRMTRAHLGTLAKHKNGDRQHSPFLCGSSVSPHGRAGWLSLYRHFVGLPSNEDIAAFLQGGSPHLGRNNTPRGALAQRGDASRPLRPAGSTLAKPAPVAGCAHHTLAAAWILHSPALLPQERV